MVWVGSTEGKRLRSIDVAQERLREAMTNHRCSIFSVAPILGGGGGGGGDRSYSKNTLAVKRKGAVWE